VYYTPQALAALHQDEDFQSDLLRLPIQRVIDDTKKNPENYERCVTVLGPPSAVSSCCCAPPSMSRGKLFASYWDAALVMVLEHAVHVIVHIAGTCRTQT
jgi:hypothetical protein